MSQKRVTAVATPPFECRAGRKPCVYGKPGSLLKTDRGFGPHSKPGSHFRNASI
jgi:hypothetical protein